MPIFDQRGMNMLQGEAWVLEASSAHATIVANQACLTPYAILGERSRLIFAVLLTAAASVVGDTLDVFIDALAFDGATWLNAIHFPQMLGNGGAKSFFGVLDTTNPGAVTFDATSDAAVGVVRPGVFGSTFRGRYTITGAGAQSYTFSLGVYAC